MLSIADPIVTQAGQTLYRDDVDPRRFYVLPSALTLARAEDGSYRGCAVEIRSCASAANICPSPLPTLPRNRKCSTMPREWTEVAPAGTGEPGLIRQVALTPEEPYHWVTLPQEAFSDNRMPWRAVLHADASGQGKTVTGAWQTAASLRALVTLAHVLPREPLRAEVEVVSDSIDEVEAVKCELASGPIDRLAAAADVHWTFVADETHTFAVWPKSVFDDGVSYRFAIVVAGPGELWTEWRYQTDMRVIMKVEDDFYATRTISVTLAAPWSQRNSPDASTHAGEIIFAEVHVQTLMVASPQSASYTFDKTNIGTALRWNVRTRNDENRYTYEVHALAADGQMLRFGPFESDRDRVSLEIYRIRVSDTSPAEFGLRTTGA